MNWPGKDDESLLWLASYPRSGNTFLRILLANYFSAGDGFYDINDLSTFCPADTAAPLWQAYAEAFGAPNGVRETWEARRRCFDHYRKTRDSRLFPGLKTHTGNILAHGVDGFDIRPSDRAIYIVRHPLDVAVSFADYNGKPLDAAIDEMLTPGAYVVDEARPGALEIRGSWTEHVENWLLAPPCGLLLIRYEALCADTPETFRAILAFLGARLSQEKLARAIEAAGFDNLREQEAAKGFREAPPGSTSGRFFRKGTSLQWPKILSHGQAGRLADGCGRLMRRIGYASV